MLVGHVEHWEFLHELCHPDWLENVMIEEPKELSDGYNRALFSFAKSIIRSAKGLSRLHSKVVYEKIIDI